jgi:hypothetical protein
LENTKSQKCILAHKTFNGVCALLVHKGWICDKSLSSIQKSNVRSMLASNKQKGPK